MPARVTAPSPVVACSPQTYSHFSFSHPIGCAREDMQCEPRLS